MLISNLYLFYARWLLTHDRFEEAEKILRNVAKFNGKPLPLDFKLHSLKVLVCLLSHSTLLSCFIICANPFLLVKICFYSFFFYFLLLPCETKVSVIGNYSVLVYYSLELQTLNCFFFIIWSPLVRRHLFDHLLWSIFQSSLHILQITNHAGPSVWAD